MELHRVERVGVPPFDINRLRNDLVVTIGGYLRSAYKWNGTSWVLFRSIDADLWSMVDDSSGNIYFGSATGGNGSGLGFEVSTNDGASYSTLMNSGTSDIGWRPVAIGGSTIVLAELNVGMYRGNTTPPYNFVKVASNLFGASVSCVNIIYVPELHVFIGAGTDGKVYQSVNDGNNWSAVGSYGASGGYVPRMRFKNGYLYVASSNSGLVIYSIESGPIPARPATGIATLANGFVIGVNLTDGGYGYTNTPRVQIIGGGGSGAQAVAVVSNGVVVAVNVLNAGYGYTSVPVVAITPPFIPAPSLGCAAMTLLSFGDLTVGGSYQLQRQQAWYWTNQGASFTTSDSTHTQMVAGAGGGNYRLVLTPAPSQAFATAQMVNGFVVGAAITSGGSGYVSAPAVAIIGGGGSNATAVAGLSGGAVVQIAITSAGIGYTNTPTLRIAAPPAASLSPDLIPVIRVDAAGLTPYENYHVQFKPALEAAWENWNGGLFSPTGVTSSQYLYISNNVGFFRLQYAP